MLHFRRLYFPSDLNNGLSSEKNVLIGFLYYDIPFFIYILVISFSKRIEVKFRYFLPSSNPQNNWFVRMYLFISTDLFDASF